jgi:hypothetical protein
MEGLSTRPPKDALERPPAALAPTVASMPPSHRRIFR